MEKGILHIKKKPRHILKDGRQIPIKKEVPEIGKEYDKLECQFEGSPAFKIVVNEKVFSFDMAEIEAKKEAIRQAKEYKEKYENMVKKQANSNDSFELIKAQIPMDTKKLLVEDGDNFALKYFKFAHFENYLKKKDKNTGEETWEQKFYFFNSTIIKDANGNIVIGKVKIESNFYGFGKNETEANDKIEKIAVQHKSSAKRLFTEGCLEVRNFKPDWRVVVGLGTDSVYETGITLHHIYGFPYIPASAIKGITHHFALDMLKKENEEDNKKLKYQVTNDNLKKVFGDTDAKGKITFFDAMPLTAPKLKPDIMNVHYPDYYGGPSAPTDTQSPRPILFLTVEDTKFQFMLGCKEDDKNLLETALKWLEKALQDKGIGAKTAVGYGYMNESCA